MIDRLNKKTRKFFGNIHKNRIKNKKGVKRVENFLKLKMPYWDNIFEKKIVTIIKKYSK